MSTIACLVKGAYFRGPDVVELSNSLAPKTLLSVQREPNNEHDEYACAVYYEDVHIGYVERDFSFAVADECDYHVECGGNGILPATLVRHEEQGRARYPYISIIVSSVGEEPFTLTPAPVNG